MKTGKIALCIAAFIATVTTFACGGTVECPNGVDVVRSETKTVTAAKVCEALSANPTVGSNGECSALCGDDSNACGFEGRFVSLALSGDGGVGTCPPTGWGDAPVKLECQLQKPTTASDLGKCPRE